jgi:hypothetical protein
MLDDAGWLNMTGAALAEGSQFDRPANTEEAAAALLLGQAEGLEILKRIESELQRERAARTPASRTKKAASRRKR